MNYFSRAPQAIALAFAMLLSVSAAATAQTETGRISGTVTDTTGGALPGTTVTARAAGSGATRTLVTDANGQYLFANLPPGPLEETLKDLPVGVYFG